MTGCVPFSFQIFTPYQMLPCSIKTWQSPLCVTLPQITEAKGAKWNKFYRINDFRLFPVRDHRGESPVWFIWYCFFLADTLSDAPQVWNFPSHYRTRNWTYSVIWTGFGCSAIPVIKYCKVLLISALSTPFTSEHLSTMPGPFQSGIYKESK